LAVRKKKRSLELELKKLQKQVGGTFDIESISVFVEESVASEISDILATNSILVNELENLQRYIREAKSEISNLRPEEVKSNFLPQASGELNAIVEATETATNEIMDATESIGQIGDKIGGEHADVISEMTMRIYQACGFQDITGQRITKIIDVFKHIEDKVDALTHAYRGVSSNELGNSTGKKAASKRAPKKKRKKSPGKKIDEQQPKADADLLGGPQLPGDAIKQDEVDALLASFD